MTAQVSTSLLAPKTSTLRCDVVTAATGTVAQVIGVAPHSGYVTAVRVIPAVSQSASDSTYHTFDVLNKGASGTGTANCATRTSKVTGGAALVNFDEFDLVINATAATRLVAAGDVLSFLDTITSTVTANIFKVEVDIALDGAGQPL